MALDRFFDQLGNDAWDLAYATVVNTARAAEAVAEAFAETLVASGETEISGIENFLLSAVHRSASQATESLASRAKKKHRSANPEATDALLRLTQDERAALWLVAGRSRSIENATRILELDDVEQLVISGAQKFAAPQQEIPSLVRDAIPAMPEWIHELVRRSWPVSGSVWWAQRGWRSLLFDANA